MSSLSSLSRRLRRSPRGPRPLPVSPPQHHRRADPRDELAVILTLR